MNHTGGTFNGPGVNGNYFYPSLAEKGNNTISYVSDSNDVCLVTISKEVTVIPSFFVPNLITPNNDRLNDSLEVTGVTPNAAITIYNNWGTKVYHIENYHNEWNGEHCSPGIYFLHIKVNEGCIKEYKGWIQLFK